MKPLESDGCEGSHRESSVEITSIYLRGHFFSGSLGLHVLMRRNHPDGILQTETVERSNKLWNFFWGAARFKKSLGFLCRPGARRLKPDAGTNEDGRHEQAGTRVWAETEVSEAQLKLCWRADPGTSRRLPRGLQSWLGRAEVNFIHYHKRSSP